MSSKKRASVKTPVLWRLRPDRRRQHSQARLQCVPFAAPAWRRADRTRLEQRLAHAQERRLARRCRLELCSARAGRRGQDVTLKFKGNAPSQAVISVVDRQHGDIRSAYEAMGSPRYPTSAQIRDLRKGCGVGRARDARTDQRGTDSDAAVVCRLPEAGHREVAHILGAHRGWSQRRSAV